MLRAVRSERGQILPLFALVVVALFAMAALLFDAAQALVMRRQLQDATDAAALAAANVIQSGSPVGCSNTAGPPPGTPRAAVTNAARTSLQANLSGSLASAAVITCPTGAWGNNGAVRVELTRTAPILFSRILGRGAFTVSTRSTAVNTFGAGHGFSVITLNPYNGPPWANSLQGCPSFLFNGSPTITSEGSIHINSNCRQPTGYALARNGNSSTVTLLNGSILEVVGDADPGAMTIVPAPIQHVAPMTDPLASLPNPNVGTACGALNTVCGALTVRSIALLTVNGTQRIFDPGVYIGGIRLQSTARAYFRPGIYVLQGGGIDVGAQAKLYTVRSTHSSTTDFATQAAWAAACPNDGSCGVLIYNQALAGTMGPYNVTAGAVFLARGYQQQYAGQGANPDYKGLLLWQARDPVPTSSSIQPMVRQNGGGSVNIAGTIYAPSAKVELNGGSGGGGGFDIDYFLQFICWDINFSGTSNWRLQYSDFQFVQPPDYGLVE